MALASSVEVILPVLLLRAGQFLSLWYRFEPGLSDTYTLPPAVSAVWKLSVSALLEEEDNLPIAKPSIKKPMQKVTRPKQKNFFESLSFLSISLFESSIIAENIYIVIKITNKTGNIHNRFNQKDKPTKHSQYQKFFSFSPPK